MRTNDSNFQSTVKATCPAKAGRYTAALGAVLLFAAVAGFGQVATGWRFGERVEILHGVQPGERVVVAAAFLVDSESRLRAQPLASAQASTSDSPAGAQPQMVAAKTVRDPSCGMPVDTAAAAASGNTLTDRGTTYYFCSRRCQKAFQNKTTASLTRHQGDDD